MRMSEWRAEMDAKVGPPRVWVGPQSSKRAFKRRLDRMEQKAKRADGVAARREKRGYW